MTEKLELMSIKVGKDVYDEVTGELISEGKVYRVMTRPGVPFRSITDLKGYTDSEVNLEPSVTNTADYIPTKKTIEMILKDHSLVELEALAEQQKQFGDYDDFASEDAIENSDDFDEIENQMDAIDYLQQQEVISQEKQEFSASAKATLPKNEATSDEVSNGADREALG